MNIDGGKVTDLGFLLKEKYKELLSEILDEHSFQQLSDIKDVLMLTDFDDSFRGLDIDFSIDVDYDNSILSFDLKNCYVPGYCEGENSLSVCALNKDFNGRVYLNEGDTEIGFHYSREQLIVVEANNAESAEYYAHCFLKIINKKGELIKKSE